MSHEPTPAAGSIGNAARSGSRWTALQFGGARLTTLLVFLVLARILTPADFGLVAIATVFVALLQILIEGGFSQALIQRVDLEPGHVDTVFWTSVATGLVLASAIAIAAGPLSLLYGEPQLASILPVLACGLLISALGSAQSAQLRRALRFRPLAVRAVVSNIIAGSVGVTVALLGGGVWALVGQNVVLNLVQTILLWFSTSWRPGLQVSRRHFVDVFSFSRNSLGNTLLQYTNQRSDDFLIGAMLGPVALGIYAVAYRLLSTLNDVINQMLLGVAFPVFARLQDDRERLAHVYTTVLKVGAVLALPGYLFFTVAAPEVVEVVFGEAWRSAAPVMAVLAIFGAVQTMIVVTESCLNAIGRPHLVFRNRLLNTVVQVGAFLVAAPFGIIWVAWALVARTVVLAPIPVWLLVRSGVVSWQRWLSSLLAPILSTAVMLGAVYAVRTVLVDEVGALGRLAAMAGAASITYAAMIAMVDRRTLQQIVEVMALRRQRKSRKAESGRVAGDGGTGSKTDGEAGAGSVGGRHRLDSGRRRTGAGDRR